MKRSRGRDLENEKVKRRYRKICLCFSMPENVCVCVCLGEEKEQVGVRLSDNSARCMLECAAPVGMKEMEGPENCACSGIFSH